MYSFLMIKMKADS